MDVFDLATIKPEHRHRDHVPARFLDTCHDGLRVHVCQALCLGTGAREGIKRALKGMCDESLWDYVAGTVDHRSAMPVQGSGSDPAYAAISLNSYYSIGRFHGCQGS